VDWVAAAGAKIPTWLGALGSVGGQLLRQARHALKLQHQAQRHSHVNRFNFAKCRGVELLFDMLPRRPLPMTVGQTMLYELAYIGKRL